jgi:hypothetical protein
MLTGKLGCDDFELFQKTQFFPDPEMEATYSKKQL